MNTRREKMIIVSNTKELQERYNLNELPDDEKVIIQGGLKDKPKYNADRYYLRTTYTVRQLKRIIGQMSLIESQIPREWNEYQRAKYIYETIGSMIEYNFNREEYKTQQSSNLTGLLSRKSICAGYALIYKEMMDRQGIQCDYVKGLATGGDEKDYHAWNVLTINGQSFPVDLTWDSNIIRKGERELKYFGVDPDFEYTHISDSDEKSYVFTTLSRNFVNSINTNPKDMQHNLREEQKMSIIQLAMEETYTKFKQTYGMEVAKLQIEKATEKYINSKNADGFTRQRNARQQLEQYVSPDDMLELIAKSYINQISFNKQRTILEDALNEDMLAHGYEHATNALVSYITSGKINVFTRNNNARRNILEFVTTEEAENLIIRAITERTINDIERSSHAYTEILDEARNGYFYGYEFAKVQLPEEKRKGIITKTISWIKEKTREKRNMNKKNIGPKNKNVENQR